MVSRIEPRDEGITGTEEARKYAEKHRRYTGLMYRPLLNILQKHGLSGSYLEVGAGPGFLAATIAHNNPEVEITAIDISPDMVTLAKGHVEETGVEGRIRCLVGDVGDSSFIESLGRFDLVYSAFSVHHWKDPERCLANIQAAVKDTGAILLYDLNRVWWLRLLPFGGGELQRLREAYSSSEMRALLHKAGIRNFTIGKHYAGLMQSVLVEAAGTPRTM